MSPNETVREAQSVEASQAGAKQEATTGLSRIPLKVEQAVVLRKSAPIRAGAGLLTTRCLESRQIQIPRAINLHTGS